MRLELGTGDFWQRQLAAGHVNLVVGMQKRHTGEVETAILIERGAESQERFDSVLTDVIESEPIAGVPPIGSWNRLPTSRKRAASGALYRRFDRTPPDSIWLKLASLGVHERLAVPASLPEERVHDHELVSGGILTAGRLSVARISLPEIAFKDWDESVRVVRADGTALSTLYISGPTGWVDAVIAFESALSVTFEISAP